MMLVVAILMMLVVAILMMLVVAILMMLVVAILMMLVAGVCRVIVVADDQCSSHKIKSPFYPGKSCEDIYNKNPQSHNKSGYQSCQEDFGKVFK